MKRDEEGDVLVRHAGGWGRTLWWTGFTAYLYIQIALSDVKRGFYKRCPWILTVDGVRKYGRVSRLLTHTAKSVVESKLSKHCLVLYTAEDCARRWSLLLSAGSDAKAVEGRCLAQG